MAIMNINFTSRCLAMKTSVWVAYPTPTLGEMMQRKDKYDPEKRWPVVYMLHGAGGDGFEWIQRADMEQLCCQYGFIAVMPDAALSCYNDTPYGAKYYTYISEELPAMIEATFHASTDARDRYIMGYSMGGFGAVKIVIDQDVIVFGPMADLGLGLCHASGDHFGAVLTARHKATFKFGYAWGQHKD